jgi:hypothetical protein
MDASGDWIQVTCPYCGEAIELLLDPPEKRLVGRGLFGVLQSLPGDGDPRRVGRPAGDRRARAVNRVETRPRSAVLLRGRAGAGPYQLHISGCGEVLQQ